MKYNFWLTLNFCESGPLARYYLVHQWADNGKGTVLYMQTLCQYCYYTQMEKTQM